MVVQYMFWDSGFGINVNGMLVDGDLYYDNVFLVFQYVLIGLSDFVNLIVFYENDVFLICIVYNWCDKFFVWIGDGFGDNLVYIEVYGQWDFNVSYDVIENLIIFVEGINLINEYQC